MTNLFKVDIQSAKVDIQSTKVDIHKRIKTGLPNLSEKSIKYIIIFFIRLYLASAFIWKELQNKGE